MVFPCLLREVWQAGHAPLTTLLHSAFVSPYVGGGRSRSGSHSMPWYLVIPALWFIGLWGSVGCSCGAVTQGDSCSVCWKSHRSSLLLEDRRTTQFAWMLHIFCVFFWRRNKAIKLNEHKFRTCWWSITSPISLYSSKCNLTVWLLWGLAINLCRPSAVWFHWPQQLGRAHKSYFPWHRNSSLLTASSPSQPHSACQGFQ